MALNKSKTVSKTATKAATKPATKPATATVAKPSTNGKAASNGKEPVKSDKSAFLAAAKQGAEQWKKSRTVEARTGGGQVVLKTGVYKAKVSAVVLTTKDVEVQDGKVRRKIKAAQVQIGFTLTDGDFKGCSVRMFQTLSNEVGWNIVSETLQKFGYDVTGYGLPEMAEALEQVGKEKPDCTIYARHKVFNEKPGNDIYVNSVIQSDSNTETTKTAPEDTNDEGEAVELTEGMEVVYESKDYTITKVIEDEGEITVNLKDAKGKKVTGVSPSDLEIPQPAED